MTHPVLDAIGEFLLYPFYFLGWVAGEIANVVVEGWKDGRE